MLSHLALALLADPNQFSAGNCQRVIQLCADYDFSLPHTLLPRELDHRYNWHTGTTQSLLNKLVKLELMIKLGTHTYMLAKAYTWTPRSLAEQWQKIEASQQRGEMVTLNS
jgi:hypothetical protein